MKTTISLLFAILTNSIFGQINYLSLNQNNASILISNEGTVFTDFDNAISGYEIPKNSGLNSIYSTQFWFAGKTLNGQINTSRGGYPNYGRDVFKGPYSIGSLYSEPDYQEKWGSSMWEICQSDIDIYKLWWECNNNPPTTGCENVQIPSNELIERIYNWPANGDLNLGNSYSLAPFWDYNSDGYYSPEQGDYPIIKGCCAVYMIQNDHAGTHTFSGGTSIGIEVHYMFYQYTTADYLNDVTFIDVLTINKSANDYSEFATGLLMDADIGNYSDDFFGCDSTENLMLFYNGDNFDQDNYLDNPPAIGVVSLENEMTACLPYQSTSSSMDVWNLLNGKKIDGSYYIHPEGFETKYFYSGDPLSSSQWNQTTTGLPSNDCRSIASSSHGQLQSGDSIFNSYAVIYSRIGNNLENAQSLINLSNSVKSFYDTESDIPCSSGVWGIDENDIVSYAIIPNPANGKFTINQTGSSDLTVEICDISGKFIGRFTELNSTNISIDLTNSSKGIYLLNISNGTNTKTERILIQ